MCWRKRRNDFSSINDISSAISSSSTKVKIIWYKGIFFVKKVSKQWWIKKEIFKGWNAKTIVLRSYWTLIFRRFLACILKKGFRKIFEKSKTNRCIWWNFILDSCRTLHIRGILCWKRIGMETDIGKGSILFEV